MALASPETGNGRIRCEFLGWDVTVLPAVVEVLIKRYRVDFTLDLSEVIVVVPGQRVGRRLRELLVDAADQNKCLLTPPEVVTEGRLPELLYQPRPFASALVSDWPESRAVDLNPTVRVTILHPPGDTSLRWPAFAMLAGGREPAADGHDRQRPVRRARLMVSDQARWTPKLHTNGVPRQTRRTRLWTVRCPTRAVKE